MKVGWALLLLSLRAAAAQDDPPSTPPPATPPPATPPQPPATPPQPPLSPHPPDSPSPPAPPPPSPPFRLGRLVPLNRTLLLDGEPHLFRGVAYSPTPIGIEPSGDQSLDFFTEEYSPIYMRDLPRMQAAGVNSIRIYAMETHCEGPASSCVNTHQDFLDECFARNITVMGGFELHATHHYLREQIDYARVEFELRDQLQRLTVGGEIHPAIVMWNVGNEVNLPSAGYMCDPQAPEEGVSGNVTHCMFNGTEIEWFFSRIDDLCRVVVEEFKLIGSTPLAECARHRTTRYPPVLWPDHSTSPGSAPLRTPHAPSAACSRVGTRCLRRTSRATRTRRWAARPPGSRCLASGGF